MATNTPNPPDLTAADRATISDLLGHSGKGVTLRAIAARDAQGQTAVITNHPLRRAGTKVLPFPTMYWLIDPVWCKRAADLERDGAVGQLERCIAADETLRQSLEADHRGYAAARWALLAQDEQQHAIDAGYATTLRDKGIGGIADFTKIKCLHLHLAHHLAELAAGRDGTTVGKLVEARLGVRI